MFALPYGNTSLAVPDLWNGEATVLTPGTFPDRDPEEIVREALNDPSGALRLEDVCRPGDRIACVVPDLTRRAGVGRYLPVLLQVLEDSGIGPDKINIIVALGIHRPLTVSEKRELVGQQVFKKYSVINHDADFKGSCVHLGTTDAGIPVQINRYVADSDCVILTGGVTPHYFAGYGGGRKALLPGVASRRSCEAHHKLVVSWRRGELAGSIGPGVLENNPVHRQMLQACSFLPSLYVLNVVTEPTGGIVAAAAGELEAAHLKACQLYDVFFRKELPVPSKLVIASSGGCPRDINFVQAHKGLYNAHQAVAPDGAVILAANCTEGMGHDDFLGWFDRCALEKDWLDELQSRYQINGQTAFSTWLKVHSVPTVLISSLKVSEVKKMGMIPARDMEEAISAVRGVLGELPAPLIIPDAGDVLPVIMGSKNKVRRTK